MPATPEQFIQEPPRTGNPYRADHCLREYLRRVLPPDMRAVIEPELAELGERAAGELRELQLTERLNEPRLIQSDAWGQRLDQIELTSLWRRAEEIAAGFGLVAHAYERRHAAWSRIHQFALVYLFHPYSDLYTCPLAMTDGAARVLLDSGNQPLIDRAVPHLTAREPAALWTSGQWMTESSGGSDVGESRARAESRTDGTWRLWGRKWFTSAATSQMALTLARPDGNPGGGKGLALFYVETRDAAGRPNGFTVDRLKDKLGTRKLPTAELTLNGTPAIAVMGTKDGVRNIAPMLNVTRIWNSVVAASAMRFGVACATDYARRRVAFGAPIIGKPLHADTLAMLEAETRAAFHLSFFVAELTGRIESGEGADADRQLLRLLTAITKLTTGRQALAVVDEVMECFGGAGYVEDTGIPALVRDTHVLPIWEGTTNVLSLEALDALARGDTFSELLRIAQQAVTPAADGALVACGRTAIDALKHAQAWYFSACGDTAVLEAGARRFALTLGRALALALLVEQAQWSLEQSGDQRARHAARRFAAASVDCIRDGLQPAEAAALLDT